jgi:glycogen operon protein
VSIRLKGAMKSPIRGTDGKDLAWFEPSGREMNDVAWNNPMARCLGIRIDGNGLGECDEMGEPLESDTLFVMLNAHSDAVLFKLPECREGERWERLVDSAEIHWGRRTFLRDPAYKPAATRW